MASEELVANTTDIRDLFADTVFRIPKYQRSYSWEEPNWEDLWNDIKDGMDTETEHYWGTITLRRINKKNLEEIPYWHEKNREAKVYEIVDGQQRITTFYLFMFALSELGLKGIEEDYLKFGDFYRLKLGGLNRKYFEKLVGKGGNPKAELKSNRLLKGALTYFKEQLENYGDENDLKRISSYLQNSTFSLKFAVEDRRMAVKAFQSLNDRGRDLTLLDKTESYLMFYSLRFLDNKLDEKISESFGEIFRNYDLLKNYGDKIDYLQSWRFSEDDLLRLFYHYFAYTKIQEYSLPGAYNFDIGSEDVFGHFLKDSCDNLKRDPENLNNFMEEFLEEFDDFVSCFKELMKNTNKKKEVKKIFNFLGPNANMYPLIISLKKKGWLDEEMFNILESLDVRVYKIRGTNPRADLYKETISQLKNGLTKTEAKENLKDFIEDWMPIPQLKNNLNENIYPNPALKYILWEYEKEKKESFDGWDYDYYKELQIDHIFPQEEKIVFPGDGFEDEEEYISNKHKIGNLCLLEEDKNQQAKNKVPKKKSKFYRKSDVPGTRKIGIHIENKGINKKYIQERTEKIRDFCVNRWSIK